MGRRGPHPKPSALLKLAGGKPDDRVADAPSVPGFPVKPAWVTGEAAAEWDRLEAIYAQIPGYITTTDGQALGALCVSHAMIGELADQLERDGMFVLDAETGISKPHPAVKSLREWIEAGSRLGARFGMSPADRVRGTKVDANRPAMEPKGLAKFVKAG